MVAPSPPSPCGKYGPAGRAGRADQRELQVSCLLPATERPPRHYQGAAPSEASCEWKGAHLAPLADRGVGAVPPRRRGLGLGGDLVPSHSFGKVNPRCVPGNPLLFNLLRSINEWMVVFTCTTGR